MIESVISMCQTMFLLVCIVTMFWCIRCDFGHLILLAQKKLHKFRPWNRLNRARESEDMNAKQRS